MKLDFFLLSLYRGKHTYTFIYFFSYTVKCLKDLSIYICTLLFLSKRRNKDAIPQFSFSQFNWNKDGIPQFSFSPFIWNKDVFHSFFSLNLTGIKTVFHSFLSLNLTGIKTIFHSFLSLNLTGIKTYSTVFFLSTGRWISFFNIKLTKALFDFLN